jgi:hypothetical protein
MEECGFAGYSEVEIFSTANWWQRDCAEVLDTCIQRTAARFERRSAGDGAHGGNGRAVGGAELDFTRQLAALFDHTLP